MLIDTHAHLNDERLLDKAEDIVNSLEDNNIEKVINAGYDTPSSLINVELAKKYLPLYATVGIHPHDAKNATAKDYELFAKLVKENKKVVAIGEIGLDYHYDLSPREIQRKVLVEQIDLANELKMPVVFHLREAYDDMIKIFSDNKNKLKNGCVLHCYSGSRELVNQVFNKFDFLLFFWRSNNFCKEKR